MNELVSFFVGVDAREAFAFQTEDLTALGSRWNFYFSFSVDGWHFCLQAEDGFHERNMQFEGDVEAVAV